MEAIVEKMATVPAGQFLLVGFGDKKLAGKQAGALKARKWDAMLRGTNVYVGHRRNGVEQAP